MAPWRKPPPQGRSERSSWADRRRAERGRIGRESGADPGPRDAGPVGEPAGAAGRSPPGVSGSEAPHLVPAGNPVAPPTSHVATRAAASPVEQLDLFSLLAPRAAVLGAERPRGRPGRHPPKDRAPSWPFPDAKPLAVESNEAAAPSGALTAAVFDAYRPSVRVPGSRPHPTRLVESAAMAAATAPVCDYRPMLPRHLVDGRHLSDAQLETICRAGAAHAELLPGEGGAPGGRQGFFVGDGTGVRSVDA